MNYSTRKESFEKLVSQIPPLNLKNDDHDDDDDVSSIGFVELPANNTPGSTFSMGTPVHFKTAELTKSKNPVKNKTSNNNNNNNNKKFHGAKFGTIQTAETSDELSEIFEGFDRVPYSKEEIKRMLDKEELEGRNKREKLLNTAITDQLWRPVLSDPTQAKLLKSSSSSSPTSSSSHHHHQLSDNRVPQRYLHNTLVKTSSSSTESSLNNVVIFEARIITLMNKEALRDVTGFFFSVDNSITVYEYKQFGSESKALPLIKRHTYNHMHGPRTGENYLITDIIQGNDLEFPTSKQPLPDIWKSQDRMTINILSVDVEAKRNILLKDIDKYQHENVWNKLHLPKNEIEERFIRVPYQVQEIVRAQLASKPTNTYLDIGNYYRNICRQEKTLDQVNVYELERGLSRFGIKLSENKLSSMLEILDPDATSFVSYHKFMRSVLGEMEAGRRMLVVKAFLKMDSTRSGSISTSLIYKFLNAPKHSKVKTKEKNEDEIKATFVKAFHNNSPASSITLKKFEELYEGLSLKVESNERFSNILKNMWNI